MVLTVAGVSYSQSVATPEQVIQRIIEKGAFEGFDQKIIGDMGDAAAVVVTKIIAGKHPSSVNIDSTLVVLTNAFADPLLVNNASDRQPRTTMFVFQALEAELLFL